MSVPTTASSPRRDDLTNQRILVIGAGAIGSLVAASLAQAGLPVTLAGRARTAQAIRQHGLRLRLGAEVVAVQQIEAAASLAEAFADGAGYHLAVLAVKSYDTAQVVAELQAATPTPPPVLTVQNGVGNEEMLAGALGPARVLAGAITTPVATPEPGYVVLERSSRRLGLADVTGGARQGPPALPAAAVAPLFAQAGFLVRCYGDWRSLKWTKLVMNLLCNASCALLAWTPEQVWADEDLVGLEIAAWREAMAVLHGQGCRLVNLGGYPLALLGPFLRRLPVRMLAAPMRRFVSRGRGGKMPSLYVDLAQSKGRSEVGWLNGAVVHAGRQLSVRTPANRALTEALLAVVAGEEAWTTYRDRPAALLARYRN
jgi:2-dehydropantoate 2-reductase